MTYSQIELMTVLSCIFMGKFKAQILTFILMNIAHRVQLLYDTHIEYNQFPNKTKL